MVPAPCSAMTVVPFANAIGLAAAYRGKPLSSTHAAQPTRNFIAFLHRSPRTAAQSTPSGAPNSPNEDQPMGGRSAVSKGRTAGSAVCQANTNDAAGSAAGSAAKEGRTPVARQAEKSHEDCGQQPWPQGSPGSGLGSGFFIPMASPQGISPIAIASATGSTCCFPSRNGQLPPGSRNAVASSTSTAWRRKDDGLIGGL